MNYDMSEVYFRIQQHIEGMKTVDLDLYNFVIEASITKFDSKKTKAIIDFLNNNIEDFIKYLESGLFAKKGYFITYENNNNPLSINKVIFSMTQKEYTVAAHKEIVYFIAKYISRFNI